MAGRWLLLCVCCLRWLWHAHSATLSQETEGELGTVRVVFQTKYGDIEFGFFPDVAPKTAAHIQKLATLGCYNTNHFFRIDRGFVAQVADVVWGREAPLNLEQRREGDKTLPGEFSKVKHVRGVLSMGRHSDPDSAQSSFSILLGDAPHLDGQYAVFGRLTKGDDTLANLETLETRKEGMFVMPLERVSILSTYWYDTTGDSTTASSSCQEHISTLQRRLREQRIKCLP